jgi:hypothetical protein
MHTCKPALKEKKQVQDQARAADKLRVTNLYYHYLQLLYLLQHCGNNFQKKEESRNGGRERKKREKEGRGKSSVKGRGEKRWREVEERGEGKSEIKMILV